MALDVSAIVGIILMSVGTLMVVWGLVLCYTTKVKWPVTIQIWFKSGYFPCFTGLTTKSHIHIISDRYI